MGKPTDMTTDVVNLMAILNAGVDWRKTDVLMGGRERRIAAMREAARRHLIKIHENPGGPYEIEILE